MVRAPDPRLPLSTSTVLLLHEPQLFTSRNSNTALKISLNPFRYYSKASKSIKLPPYRPQINIPFSFFSSSSSFLLRDQIYFLSSYSASPSSPASSSSPSSVSCFSIGPISFISPLLRSWTSYHKNSNNSVRTLGVEVWDLDLRNRDLWRVGEMGI